MGKIEFIDLSAQQHKIRADIERAIQTVLNHGAYILGPEVAAFESALAHFTGASHVISCANGTDALTLAYRLKHLGPGDAVFVPSFTFIATAEALVELGVTPIFVDVLPDTYNIDPQSIVQGIEIAFQQDLRPKGIVAVDIFGQPANYRALLDMAERYDLWIISDAAQSMGGVSQGASVGAHAEIVTTSFFPAKPLGGYGDGGAVFLNGNAVSLAEEVLSLRFHGKGQSKYHHVRVGRNSRLDTIQAAILLEKLKIFPQEIEARNRIADRYHQGLKNHVITPSVLEGTQSSWAQYTIRLPEHVDRACMVEQLKVAGIPTMIYYETPVHQQPAYSHFPCASATGYLTVCEQLSRRVLSLPMHPYLTEAQQDKIITEVCACV